MTDPKYNRLRILPFPQRWAARARLDAGEPLFGPGFELGKTQSKKTVEEAITSSLTAYDKALKVLQIGPDEVSEALVRSAVRKLVKEHHPDIGGDVAKYREVIEARDLVLKELKTVPGTSC